jgi:hypothetical protein
VLTTPHTPNGIFQALELLDPLSIVVLKVLVLLRKITFDGLDAVLESNDIDLESSGCHE